ncbi:hypothetical protein ACOMHN_023660 [Nucella lapillus]
MGHAAIHREATPVTATLATSELLALGRGAQQVGRGRQTNAPCGRTRWQNERGESRHNALANSRGLPYKEGQGHCYAVNKAYEGGQLPPPDYPSDNFDGAVEDFMSPPAPGLNRRKTSD